MKQMAALYDTEVTVDELREDMGEVTRDSLVEEFVEDARRLRTTRRRGADETDADLMRELERFVILQVVDQRWREHLDSMDYLREGVHLRAMAQKDPLVEYRHEGHIMFEELGAQIREEVVLTLFHAQLAPEEADELQRAQQASGVNGGGLQYAHESLAGAEAIAAAGGGAGGATATLAMSGGGRHRPQAPSARS